MKKKIYYKLSILLTGVLITLSSCLKDARYNDFGGGPTIVEFPLGGVSNFGSDAITDTANANINPATGKDTDIVRQFAINIAAVNTLSTPTTVTLAVDTTLVAPYVAKNPKVNFIGMSSKFYQFTTTSVTIPAGKSTAIVSVLFHKSLLDPSKSYMLPIKIVNAGGLTISGNKSVHYYHFIGNPFAGNYTWNFTRYNTSDGSGAVSGASFTGRTVTIFPVTPTQFEVTSGYYTATERYEVTFTQVDATHFSNFQITFNSDDVANIFTGNGISVTQNPVFAYGVTPAYDPNATYSYTDALKLLTFQYVVFNGTASRFCIDNYVHQ